MHNYGYIEAEISKIIEKHTTKLEPDYVKRSANMIIDAWQDGKSVDQIVKNDKPPKLDQENLSKAAAQLDLAIKSISKVGYIGSATLKTLGNVDGAKLDQQRIEDDGRDDIINALRPISKKLKAAANKITSSDRGMIAILSGNDENPPLKLGRKKNLTAHSIARICATIFEVGTGASATVTHNPIKETNTATGAFHMFLMNVFEFLEVDANAEHVIKKLRAEQKQK